MNSLKLARNVSRPSSQINIPVRTTSLSARVTSQSQRRSSFHNSPAITMKAARVTDWNSPPEYMDVPTLPAPTAEQLRLKVLAVGVPRAVKGRAAQKHPSAFNQPLPWDPSIDGVGLDESTGDVYFMHTFAAPYFSEFVNVNRANLTQLPRDTDPVTVASLANPAASPWMALQCRAVGGCKDKTVLMLGCTGATGRAAVAIARALGASRVIGMSRTAVKLDTVKGLDARVVLEDPLVLPPDLGPVDIALDYVGGRAAIDLMKAVEIRPGANFQYIQVGGLSGEETLILPSRLINIKPIQIMASGVGSVSVEEMGRQMPELVRVIAGMDRPFEVLERPMSEVSRVWDDEETLEKRLVIVP